MNGILREYAYEFVAHYGNKINKKSCFCLMWTTCHNSTAYSH